MYFIRHGETDENVKRIVQGCGVDSVLNENGLNQGKKFYEHYKNIGFKKMYCSALKRFNLLKNRMVKYNPIGG